MARRRKSMEEKLRPPRLDPPLWTGEEAGDAELLDRLEALVRRLHGSAETLELGRDGSTLEDLEQAMNHGLCGRLRQAGEIEARGYHRVFEGHGPLWSPDRGWLVFLARIGGLKAVGPSRRLCLLDAQGAAFASTELPQSATDHRRFEWAAEDPERHGLTTAVVFAETHAFDTRVGRIRPVFPLHPDDPEGAERMAEHWLATEDLDPGAPPDRFIDWLEARVEVF